MNKRFIGKCDEEDSWIEDTQEQLVLDIGDAVNLLNYLTEEKRFVCKYTDYNEGYIEDTHKGLLLGVFETVDVINNIVESMGGNFW